jgi:hypothetical protein
MPAISFSSPCTNTSFLQNNKEEIVATVLHAGSVWQIIRKIFHFLVLMASQMLIRDPLWPMFCATTWEHKLSIFFMGNLFVNYVCKYESGKIREKNFR